MPNGPDAATLISLIRDTWPETDVATMPGGAFFSLDPEKQWPTFATIVSVYAKQRWISILNPSDATMRDVVMPILTEAHDRLAAQRARNRPTR